MDIFFADPAEVPLPPNEVRIQSLVAQPLDERRVKVYLETDPSQKRPNADLLISDEQGNPIASASIIESMTRKMELIMHLRGVPAGGTYRLQATLYFATLPDPPDPTSAPKPDAALPEIERLEVDQSSIEFTL
jgi:hypothetical protein